MNQKCQHSGCGCEHDDTQMVQRNGAFYCSEDCANDHLTEGCTCGHPECSHPSAT